MFKFIKEKMIQRDTIRELGRLSERDLADIGIRRDQIRNVAKRIELY